jgi:predicted N-acyltransferase
MQVTWVDSIDCIPRELFNTLVPLGNPSMRWEWLKVLEETAKRTHQAWKPQHAMVWNDQKLIAAAVFWWREDSWGDFVFDQEIAFHAMKLGFSWYPKLVGTVPFTAAMGWRILHRESPEGWQAMANILDAALGLAATQRSSLNLLWLEPSWISQPRVQAELSQRQGFFWPHPHFWWERGNLKNYEDFLSHLNKNDRRNARRELNSAQQHGLEIVIQKASESPREWHRTMAALYQKTNDQFGYYAARFLDNEFFEQAALTAGDWVWYVAALSPQKSTPMAMSFFVSDEVHWIGRYWGEESFYKNLHFQLCYHEPLRYILNGTGRSFDPGMGSPHKLQRGFWPYTAMSWHWVSNRQLNEILRRSFEKIYS